MAADVNVATITAPAAMSFAIPTIFEYLFLKTASAANSIAEFIISVMITIAMVKRIMQIFAALNPSSSAVMSTSAAAPKCILMQSSALSASRKPFRAFLKVLLNPWHLNFVM
jgi:hypothetical protein